MCGCTVLSICLNTHLNLDHSMPSLIQQVVAVFLENFVLISEKNLNMFEEKSKSIKIKNLKMCENIPAMIPWRRKQLLCHILCDFVTTVSILKYFLHLILIKCHFISVVNLSEEGKLKQARIHQNIKALIVRGLMTAVPMQFSNMLWHKCIMKRNL